VDKESYDIKVENKVMFKLFRFFILNLSNLTNLYPCQYSN